MRFCMPDPRALPALQVGGASLKPEFVDIIKSAALSK